MTTLIGLVTNASLLLALGLLYDTIALKRHSERPSVQVLTGVVLGAIGVAVMMAPWEFAPGIIFDTRSVLLSVGGLYFGFVPTLVAALMTGVYRLYLGGGGVWIGVAAIVTSGAIGVGWRHLRRTGLEAISSLELYILGIVVQVAVLLSLLSLPWSVAIELLSEISLPLLTVYPLGTVLLGKLMATRLERKQTEEALRKSEERFRNYVETSQDLIWESNAEGIITYLNPAWEQVTGYGPSELLGKSYFDFLAEEEVERERSQFAQHPEGTVNDDPTTYISKTGSEILLIFNTVPLYDANRNVIGTLGSAYDVTNRVRAEELLRESEERMELALQGADLGTWDWYVRTGDVTFNVRWAEMLGYTLDEIEPHLSTWENLAHPDDLPGVLEILKAHLEGRTDFYETEYRMQLKSGDWAWVLDKGRVIERDVDGKPVRACGTHLDITERKRAEEALRESRQRLEETLAQLRETQEQMMQQERLAAVGQLSAGIAHDFNNILASIVLYTQMSLRTSELSPTIRKRLELIAGEADRAADLVQRMLDFGRRAVLRREALDLGPLLEKTVALLERTIPEGIRIELALEPGDYIINADPARVQQAIVNLALNARDAMPDGGELHIALSGVEDGEIDCVDCGRVVGGEWVQVTVRDTGTGITPAVLPHIFEPFFTTRAPLGSGLGLAQVYGIVAQHGGHIEVETEAGPGTTFRLYWPAVSVARPEAQAKVQPDAAQGEGQTILVVEDNAAMRTALADVMDMLGYRVLEAANGREALAVCEEHGSDISLVLSDWVMPSMGGLALVRELEERQIAVKVLMLTGHPLDEETRRALPNSVVGWVLKPPSLEQLTEAVAQALAGSESR